jgi:hypothetical protein
MDCNEPPSPPVGRASGSACARSRARERVCQAITVPLSASTFRPRTRTELVSGHAAIAPRPCRRGHRVKRGAGRKGPPGIAWRPLTLLAPRPGHPGPGPRQPGVARPACRRVPRNGGVDPARARRSRSRRAVGDPSRLMVNSPIFYRKFIESAATSRPVQPPRHPLLRRRQGCG